MLGCLSQRHEVCPPAQSQPTAPALCLLLLAQASRGRLSAGCSCPARVAADVPCHCGTDAVLQSYYWYLKTKAACDAAGSCPMGGYTRLLHRLVGPVVSRRAETCGRAGCLSQRQSARAIAQSVAASGFC
jgi:hypothetical protein